MLCFCLNITVVAIVLVLTVFYQSFLFAELLLWAVVEPEAVLLYFEALFFIDGVKIILSIHVRVGNTLLLDNCLWDTDFGKFRFGLWTILILNKTKLYIEYAIHHDEDGMAALFLLIEAFFLLILRIQLFLIVC